MAQNFEIPTEPNRPFSERVSILGITYTLRFSWNSITQNWNVNFYDESGTIVVLKGVALVTGADLLEQFGYMDLGAQAIFTVMTVGPDLSPDSVPTFRNLGIDGHLYVTTP